jgi:hypothetical protein
VSGVSDHPTRNSAVPEQQSLRAPLTTLLHEARAVRDCALAVGDQATARRMAHQIGRIECRLAALPTGLTGDTAHLN